MPLVEGDRLLELFPHRFENVLLDRVDCPLTPASTEGSASLSLQNGDKQGRGIFLYQHKGTHYLLSPVACEFVALTGICVLKPDLQPGDICFFSTISNVEFKGRVSVTGGLSVKVNRQKDRGLFKRFSGIVTGQSGQLVSADIMAYALKPSGDSDASAGGKKSAPPARTVSESVDKKRIFPEKSPWMVFADAVTDF